MSYDTSARYIQNDTTTKVGHLSTCGTQQSVCFFFSLEQSRRRQAPRKRDSHLSISPRVKGGCEGTDLKKMCGTLTILKVPHWGLYICWVCPIPSLMHIMVHSEGSTILGCLFFSGGSEKSWNTNNIMFHVIVYANLFPASFFCFIFCMCVSNLFHWFFTSPLLQSVLYFRYTESS